MPDWSSLHHPRYRRQTESQFPYESQSGLLLLSWMQEPELPDLLSSAIPYLRSETWSLPGHLRISYVSTLPESHRFQAGTWRIRLYWNPHVQRIHRLQSHPAPEPQFCVPTDTWFPSRYTSVTWPMYSMHSVDTEGTIFLHNEILLYWTAFPDTAHSLHDRKLQVRLPELPLSDSEIPAEDGLHLLCRRYN